MIKLARYTRPYLWMILLSILLLFAQANFDLALPDYLSRMVNTGIQQGGVENAVPVAIRQAQMNRAFLFMSTEEKNTVLASYTLINSDSAEYDKYSALYPVLEKEPIYLLNTASPEQIDRLNPVMAKSLLAEKMDELPQSMREKFVVADEEAIIQAGASLVKNEYAALGLDTEKLQNDYILNIGVWMLGLTLLAAICTILVGYLSSKIAAGMARDIRRDVFQKVEHFSNTEFDHFSTASLITRTTNDVTQVQMVVVMIVRMVFYAPLLGIGGIIKVVNADSPLAWLIGLAVALLIGQIIVVFSVSLPKFKLVQSLTDRINLVARENLTGMMVIRAFNMQGFEEQRFDKANNDLTSVSLFINRVMVVMFPLMMLIMNLLMVGIIWFGAQEIANAHMQVGDLMAFTQYAMQIVMSFLMLSMMFIIIPRASVSASRIAEVLEVEPRIHDPQQPRQFPTPFHGTVEFRNVNFRYPGADTDALDNISFTAQPGQVTALIGSTGAGKSTIVNLIPRFYEVSSGAILVNGVDIREVTQHDLRNQIGYVPQKSALFSGSIESNLRYADKNATPEQIETAIEIAQAKEFVQSSPTGLSAEIAQGGQNISGGQKQRLSIARAIVKKPPIYILDDSFSALDFKTDAALRRAFKEQAAGSTLILVTQRVSTIKTADQIIVIDEGKIVGNGTHHELLETCETYREIATSQLTPEELR